MSAEERADALIDERELATALRGLRAEPDAFRAAVERRIREKEAKAAGAGPEVRSTDDSWWRRAAAWLPSEIVPASLAATGAKLSWKVLFGLLVLPALGLKFTLPVLLPDQNLHFLSYGLPLAAAPMAAAVLLDVGLGKRAVSTKLLKCDIQFFRKIIKHINLIALPDASTYL